MPVQLAARKSCAVPEAAPPPSLASPAKKQMPCVRLGLAPHRKRMGGKGGHAPHCVISSSPIIRTKISVNLPPYSCPLGLSGAPDNSAD